jgi:hypothetical protein
VQQAQPLALPEERVTQFAHMLVAAEEVVSHRARALQHSYDAVAILSASEHGAHESDPQEARRAYGNARKAQQIIHNSVRGLACDVRKFEQLLSSKYDSLQRNVKEEYPLKDIVAACNLLKAFAAQTKLPPEGPLEITIRKKARGCLTKSGHAFQWWRAFMPQYSSKWNDMHSLARHWRLTDAKDLESFQRHVKRLEKIEIAGGVTTIMPCPRWALP